MVGRCLLAILAMALLPGEVRAQAREPLVVIVSPEWDTIESIELLTLRRVYLGKLDRVGDTRAEAIHLRPGSVERRAWIRIVIGQRERDLERYWIEQALTGRGVPPLELGEPALVRSRVAARRGRIGYVPLSAMGAEGAPVRILGVRVGGKTLSPTDPAYPIRVTRPQSRD